jgi:hypothetical protein
MRVLSLTPVVLAVLLSSCSTADKTEPPHVYQMGESARAGHLIYTLFERQWHTQFGNGIDARMPQNRFYLLQVSVVNSGGADVIIPNTELVDDNGTNYSEETNGDGVQDWIGTNRQVSPSETTHGYLLFDVPAKHYRLKVTGEDEKQIALIDIPLSFGSDTPDVGTPLDVDKIPTKK